MLRILAVAEEPLRPGHAIAGELFVSAKTVEPCIRSIFQKLDLVEAADDHRRVRAVLECLEESPQHPCRAVGPAEDTL
jgi:hypothetical protein